jgi:hypothetical protein
MKKTQKQNKTSRRRKTSRKHKTSRRQMGGLRNRAAQAAARAAEEHEATVRERTILAAPNKTIRGSDAVEDFLRNEELLNRALFRRNIHPEFRIVLEIKYDMNNPYSDDYVNYIETLHRFDETIIERMIDTIIFNRRVQGDRDYFYNLHFYNLNHDDPVMQA